MAANSAVLVQNACKSYGKREVLKNLCMEVPRGSIYGLLGASGCGKTTLLSCVVGRRNLNSGDIWVLGGQPGTVGSGVPGAKIGYMPQEIALVGEFTVQDAIYYFGRIFNMGEKLIEERFIQLSNLLDLPPKSRYVKDCSGGQQRRISFAASMVHMPELLILDEPTAGVDPILRERIWDYLVEITSNTDMAVIITTHYIEEARQANVIGLMRNGYLLAEESPTRLLNMFQTDVLEEVFLILSQKQHDGRLAEVNLVKTTSVQSFNTNASIATLNTTQGSTDVLTQKDKPKKVKKVNGYQVNSKRVTALLDKNFKQFYRNISGIIFIILFPIAQNLCFLFAVGGDIHDVNFAIVNQESMVASCPHFTTTDTAIPYSFSSCHFKNLSCRFLDYLDIPMIKKIEYDSLSDALEGIKHGDVVGVLFMAENYTSTFEERLEQGRNADTEVLSFSEIKVWMDMSNRQIGATIKYKLIDLFLDYEKSLLKDCNLNPHIADISKLHLLYGDKDDTFTEYVTPGLVMTLMFFMMTLMTSQIIITDRSEGVWDRSIIAGVSSTEIILTHFVIQLGIVVTYTVQIVTITFVIFGIKIAGSMWIIILLTFLQGVAGVGYGFWISIVSYNVSMANILATGSFYIMILICGLMWPLESMPVFLQWISKCLPFTIPMDSFRNVMKRGWPISNFGVFIGLIIEVVWIIIFGIVNTVLIQNKR